MIEFRTDESLPYIVAATYREANIPMIALEIPHPGATCFGAGEYRAGLSRLDADRGPRMTGRA